MVRLLTTSIKGLLATRVEYPFGGTTTKCSAFFVPRTLKGKDSENGTQNNDNKNSENVWIYSSSHVNDYRKQIEEELGGIKYQLLNHRDEASKFSNVLDAPVFCHILEKDAIESKGCEVGVTYSGTTFGFGSGDNNSSEDKEVSDSDLVAYHTPGHSVGVTSYLWKASDHTSVLFTGDSLYINHGKYEMGPLMFHSYDGNVQDMIHSFELMLRLNPTHIVPGLIQGDDSEFVNKFDPDQIQQLIAKLKKESGSQ